MTNLSARLEVRGPGMHERIPKEESTTDVIGGDETTPDETMKISVL
jgi:hypothetical protein